MEDGGGSLRGGVGEAGRGVTTQGRPAPTKGLEFPLMGREARDGVQVGEYHEPIYVQKDQTCGSLGTRLPEWKGGHSGRLSRSPVVGSHAPVARRAPRHGQTQTA